MSWSHGYNVSSGYIFGFYPEMTPDRLDFAALVNGYRPPGTGQSFRYLELGCGQGYGLCLMAASHPWADFHGVDFNPEHIAHARALARAARLNNIRFDEEDLSVLAQHWPADYGRFDYVALHGVYSWVSEALRQDIVRVLDTASAPGALVYLSYNSQPGAASAEPFRHLLHRLKRQSALPPAQLLGQGLELFEALFAAGAGIAEAQPQLKKRLELIRTQDVKYLSHEYLNEQHHPLWFSQVAAELGGAKLGYVGSAKLADNFTVGMLAKELADIVRAAQDPTMQQELIDLAINQSFRRDIYCRGPRLMRRSVEQLGGYTVHAGTSLERRGTEIATTTVSAALVEAIAEALHDGPRTIAELATVPALASLPKHQPIQIAALLLHSGHLSLGAHHAAETSVRAFNQAVSEAVVEEFLPYGHLAGRHSSAGVAANDIEMALYSLCAADGAPPPALLGEALLDRLLASGRSIVRDGKPLQQRDEQLARVVELTAGFIDETLPLWRRLGVI